MNELCDKLARNAIARQKGSDVRTTVEKLSEQ